MENETHTQIIVSHYPEKLGVDLNNSELNISNTRVFNTKFYEETLLHVKDIGSEILNKSIVSYGRVLRLKGASIVIRIPKISVGSLCYIYSKEKVITGIVTGFNESSATVAIFDNIKDVSVGDEVVSDHKSIQINSTNLAFGVVLNCLGVVKFPRELRAVQRPPIAKQSFNAKLADSNLSSRRRSINTLFVTGVPVLDRFLKIGVGQRMGIFAKAGLGKSYLIKMLLTSAKYDYAVVGLIGERGREVQEFYELVKELQLEDRVIIVAETSEKSPLRRFYASKTATEYAKHLQRQGKNVLLIIDSLTRVARAIRDFSIDAGELPVQRGLTASVFRELPKLIEKCGNFEVGSITTFYTVLIEDTQNDLLCNEIKSLLDGHLVLTDEARNEGFLPPIDCVESISRLQLELCNETEKDDVRFIRRFFSRLRNSRDMITFGGVPDNELKVFIEFENELRRCLTDPKISERELWEVVRKVKQ